MTYSVLIVDDHELIRSGLRRALDATEDFLVIAEAQSCIEAIATARKFQPQLVTLDISLPDGSGLDLIATLKNDSPNSSFLVLTMFPETDFLTQAIDAGASGFLSKESSTHEIVAVLRTMTINPQSFTSPYLSKSRHVAHAKRLTPAELKILRLLVNGKTIKEIGEELIAAPSTIKTHVTHIYRKLECRNRAEAVAKSIRTGIITTLSP